MYGCAGSLNLSVVGVLYAGSYPPAFAPDASIGNTAVSSADPAPGIVFWVAIVVGVVGGVVTAVVLTVGIVVGVLVGGTEGVVMLDGLTD